jgi:hypothetical protein
MYVYISGTEVCNGLCALSRMPVHTGGGIYVQEMEVMLELYLYNTDIQYYVHVLYMYTMLLYFVFCCFLVPT